MRILFIPDSYYLSNPIFLAVAKKAVEKNHNCIYFDTQDSAFNTNKINENLDQNFAYCFSMEKAPKITLSNTFKVKEFNEFLYFWLSVFNPDVIVTTTDMGGYANRACNNWAEKNNVPYIIIQSAFLEAPRYNTKDAMRNRFGYLLLNKILDIPLFRRQEIYGCEKKSNYLFLWGKDFKKMYKGTVIENNIRLVGNPVFDNMKSRINTDDIFKTPKIPVALLCPSMFKGVISGENEIKIQKMYRDIIKQNPKVHFIVKVHPRETEKQYEELFKNCGNNYFITKTANLYELFRIVDVQISLVSYSSFEAIVAGVPVILLGNHILNFPFDQFNHKAIWKPRNMLQFNAVLQVCLSKKYIRKFRKLRVDYLSTKLKYLGSSAEHIVNEIEAIVE